MLLRVAQIALTLRLSESYAYSMKGAAFNHMIAQSLGKPEKTVSVVARHLKEAKLLTTGARGVNAPDMKPMDAARMVIALLTTDNLLQSVERVRLFGQIKYSPNFKKSYRGYETMKPEHFAELFQGETLEEVLAYLFGLPATVGLEESCKWFNQHVFHLRVSEFDVLAELSQWIMEGSEIVGELVVPFKGETHPDGVRVIKGGIRTERSIIGLKFIEIGIALMVNDQGELKGVE